MPDLRPENSRNKDEWGTVPPSTSANFRGDKDPEHSASLFISKQFQFTTSQLKLPLLQLPACVLTGRSCGPEVVFSF
jgi:hypothetical protein